MAKKQKQTLKIPLGYKETKVGWIPENWKDTTVAKIAKVSTGGTPSRTNQSYWNGTIPWIATGKIDFNLINDPTEYITEDGVKNSSTKPFPIGTLLIAMFGQGVTRGKVAILGIEAAFNQACSAIVPQNGDSSTYLFYWLMYRYQHVRRMGQVGTQSNLNASIIKSIQVSLPPIPEQKKIAAMLGKWNEGIEKTGKLIATKRKMKKALCQQLLTGKKRFKEFEGQNWKEYRLHEVVKTLFSNVDKKSYENELPVLLCNYMDVYKNQYITDEIPFMQATAKESEVHKFSLKLDDVVITKDSETPDDIANSAVVVKPLKNVLCGYHLAILRPLKNVVLGLFLAHMLMLQVIRHQFSRVANGATRFGLSVGDIKKVPICIPSIDEQQKIASVLKTANREIELLSDKLEALKNQKKGLMQKLLTGKIRVKV